MITFTSISANDVITSQPISSLHLHINFQRFFFLFAGCKLTSTTGDEYDLSGSTPLTITERVIQDNEDINTPINEYTTEEVTTISQGNIDT